MTNFEKLNINCDDCPFNKKCPDLGGCDKAIEWANTEIEEEINTQSAKSDKGKPRLAELVPLEIIYAIARVREYGTAKYKDPENWKKVEPERYRDALFRHLLAYLENPAGTDEESGLKHLEHIACNVAFLLELEKNEKYKN